MDEVVEWLEHGDLETHVVGPGCNGASACRVGHIRFATATGASLASVQSLVLAQQGLLVRLSSARSRSTSAAAVGRTTCVLAAPSRAGSCRTRSRCRSVGALLRGSAHIEQAGLAAGGRSHSAGTRWAVARRTARRAPRMARPAGDRARTQPLRWRGARGYASEADISLATASSDLRRLVDAGLVVQQRGRTRSTRCFAFGDPACACRQSVGVRAVTGHVRVQRIRGEDDQRSAVRLVIDRHAWSRWKDH